MTSNTDTTATIGTALQQIPEQAFITLYALHKEQRAARTTAILYRDDMAEGDRHWAAAMDAANATRGICTEFDSPLTVGACHAATFAYYRKLDDGTYATHTPARSDQYGLVYINQRHSDYRAMRAALKYDGTRAVKAPADLDIVPA